MSDFTVPSYRIRPQRTGFEMPWRIVAMAAGGIAVLAAVGGGAWYLMKRGSGAVPVIEADNRPIRVRPDDPGGLRVANQDERIFDARRGGTAPAGPGAGQGSAQQRLAPDAERPDVNALRQAAQTRPQTPAAQAPAPQAAQPPGRPGQPAVAQPGTAALPATPSVPAGPPAGSLVPLPSSPLPSSPGPVAATAPVAPPVQPAPPAATRPNNPRILIQVGALGSEEAARAEWDRIKRRVPELGDRQPSFPRVDRGADQAPVWRIRTAGFPDADAARTFCEGVRAKSIPCTVVGG